MQHMGTAFGWSQRFNVEAKPGFQHEMETILTLAAIIMNSDANN